MSPQQPSTMPPERADPKGLIRESFAISGITEAECRSILIDWALSLGQDCTAQNAAQVLLAHYAPAPDHPMTQLLRAALTPAPPARRGGRGARLGY